MNQTTYVIAGILIIGVLVLGGLYINDVLNEETNICSTSQSCQAKGCLNSQQCVDQNICGPQSACSIKATQ